MKVKILQITFLNLLLIVMSCEEDELYNPYDSTTSPDVWSPYNLNIEQISYNELKLTWNQKEQNIQFI